jgi:hypothetical protein
MAEPQNGRYVTRQLLGIRVVCRARMKSERRQPIIGFLIEQLHDAPFTLTPAQKLCLDSPGSFRRLLSPEHQGLRRRFGEQGRQVHSSAIDHSSLEG